MGNNSMLTSLTLIDICMFGSGGLVHLGCGMVAVNYDWTHHWLSNDWFIVWLFVMF